jgi:hypothetical protein
MRRVRLLIYDGPEEWQAAVRSREHIKPGRNELGTGIVITSRELGGAEFNPEVWAREHGYAQWDDETWHNGGSYVDPTEVLQEFVEGLAGIGEGLDGESN